MKAPPDPNLPADAFLEAMKAHEPENLTAPELRDAIANTEGARQMLQRMVNRADRHLEHLRRVLAAKENRP